MSSRQRPKGALILVQERSIHTLIGAQACMCVHKRTQAGLAHFVSSHALEFPVHRPFPLGSETLSSSQGMPAPLQEQNLCLSPLIGSKGGSGDFCSSLVRSFALLSLLF